MTNGDQKPPDSGSGYDVRCTMVRWYDDAVMPLLPRGTRTRGSWKRN